MLLLLATVFTSPGCKKIFTRSKDAEISNPFNSALKIKRQRYQENNIMLKNLGMKNSDKSHDNYILLLLMLRAAWLMSLQFILNPTLVK